MFVPMNGKKVGIGLIVAAVGYVGYTLFGATKKLQFGAIKLKNKQIKLDGLYLSFVISITNNDKDTSLPFDGFNGGLFYGTTKLSTISMSNKHIISKNSTKNVSFDLFISWFGIASDILSFIKSGDFLNAAFVKGKIKSGGLFFDVNQKITF